MIEINLLPPDEGPRRTGFSRRAAARMTGAIRFDVWFLGSAVATLAALGSSIQLLRASSRLGPEMETKLREAVADSVRVVAEARARQETDRVRDSLVHRILRIEALDRSRYRWAHLLDEISRALPAGVRIRAISEVVRPPSASAQAGLGTGVQQADSPNPTRLRVEGVAIDNSALTRYWNGLEASLFIRNVHLVNTEAIRAVLSADSSRTRYHFVLEADSEEALAGALDHEPTGPGAA